jgi:hypothetical protein
MYGYKKLSKKGVWLQKNEIKMNTVKADLYAWLLASL